MPGVYFTTMFRADIFIRKEDDGVRQLPMRLEIDSEILTTEERLMGDLDELEEDYYDNNKFVICVVVHEIPWYWAFNKNGYIKEWVYRYGDKLSESSHCTAIGAYTDEVASLVKFQRGDVVCVLKDCYLKMGIVISHTDSGCYDLIIFMDGTYLREQIPISRVFDKSYRFVFDKNIASELRNRLNDC